MKNQRRWMISIGFLMLGVSTMYLYITFQHKTKSFSFVTSNDDSTSTSNSRNNSSSNNSSNNNQEKEHHQHHHVVTNHTSTMTRTIKNSSSRLPDSTVPKIRNNSSSSSSLLPDATLVVQLTGEMGNQLSHIVQGYSIHLLLAKPDGRYNITTNIVFKPQLIPSGAMNPKTFTTQKVFQSCFPVLMNHPSTKNAWNGIISTKDGNRIIKKEIVSKLLEQREVQFQNIWNNKNTSKQYKSIIDGLKLINKKDIDEIHEGLYNLQQLVQSIKTTTTTSTTAAGSSSLENNNNNNNNHDSNDYKNDNILTKMDFIFHYGMNQLEQLVRRKKTEYSSLTDSSLSFVDLPDMVYDETNEIIITLPYVYLPDMIDRVHINHHYSEIRKIFTLNETSDKCCKERAYPDETVLHVRNFEHEMKEGKNMGFEELSARKMADELLSNLEQGDRVAITTRFNDAYIQNITSAFQSRGLIVRVIEGQSGIQDFCFLMSAQKELIGTVKSTYLQWAAYLGTARRARMYLVDSPTLRKSTRWKERSQGGDWSKYASWFSFNWTNPELQSRIVYETYRSEEW